MSLSANNPSNEMSQAASGHRAPDGGAGDVHLGKATEEELKRLATHPVQEVERLREEMHEGETASSLFLLVGSVAISMWFLAALLMLAAFLVAYFVAR